MKESIKASELREILSLAEDDVKVFVWPHANDDPDSNDMHIYLITDPAHRDRIIRIERGDGLVLYPEEERVALG